ncbi:MAG: hypothetical protein HYU66_10925 [Armatimonadetes bacterium]|nr:hypothetical protein [Armatimonadota bacterium]
MRSCWLLLLASRLLAAGLVNGDFGAAGRAPDGMPDGWYAVPPDAASAGNLSVQQRGALGGGCLVFTDPWPNRSVAAMSWFYPAVPGETYRTTCRVFNDTGDGWLYLQFFSDPIETRDAAHRVWEKHAGSGKAGEWATISIDGVCPPTARYVQLCLYSSIGNVGSCAFDDVTLDGPAGPGEPVAPQPATEKPVDLTYLRNVGDRKQLLFDDAFFESHTGFWWRICPPTKTGEQNVVADRPWETFTLNAWTSLIEDEGRCRLWYECYDKTYTSDLQARYAYAESTDGIPRPAG